MAKVGQLIIENDWLKKTAKVLGADWETKSGFKSEQIILKRGSVNFCKSTTLPFILLNMLACYFIIFYVLGKVTVTIVFPEIIAILLIPNSFP